MITLDMRGKQLKETWWHASAYPARQYREHAISYSHRETTDEDISRAEVMANRDGAEMVMIQEYGISWYIPN